MGKLKLIKTSYSLEKLLGIFSLTVGLIALTVSAVKGLGVGLIFATVGIVCGVIVLAFSKQKLVSKETFEIPIINK